MRYFFVLYIIIIKRNHYQLQKEGINMSEYVLQEFFKDESLLGVSMGQDGMLGFFASRYPTIIAMTRTLIEARDDICENGEDIQEKLCDAREGLWFLDCQINTNHTLSPSEQQDYTRLQHEIKSLETKLETISEGKKPIFFRGSPLMSCPELEFIQKVDSRFPGLLESLCEFDRLIRMPIAKYLGRGISWAVTPLRVVVGLIVQKAGLGQAGSLIYMLIDHYPNLIMQRINAEEPSTQPDEYCENEINGYGIKEIKTEVVIKEYN